MGKVFSRGGGVAALFAAAVVVGCGPSGTSDAGKDKDRPAAKKDDGHDHSQWWCSEHGLPEEVCDLCDKKYAKAEKAKGNWCEHNRVKTSCFKCNPGLQKKYAAEYKAKYGKEPPAVEEEKPADKAKGKT